MIIVQDLYKSFDDLNILKKINAKFERGKTNLIIGQSGSGKTVLLKCLLGLFSPDRGKIFFNDISLTDLKNEQRRLLRQEMGIVFQGSALFDSMNVEENIIFPLKMFTSKSNEEMLERVNEVINRVNLVNSNQKMPSELSGGMQKRVAIARAIVMNPKFLFCDEPNSGLDPKTAIIIDNLIQEITKEYGITTVINTHDMNSVMEIGENIIFLKDGLKEWEGTKEDLFNSQNSNFDEFVYSSEILKKVKEFMKK
tara:strand:+ start:135 stop:893 length:759 start_codon:yes stop_codon:yes gene_type:complete